MILTIGDWERQAIQEIPLTETHVSYPLRLFEVLELSPGSPTKAIDITKTKLYVKYPPEQYPKIAWYVDDTINKSNQLAKLGNLKAHYIKLITLAKTRQHVTDELRSTIIATYSNRIRDLEERIDQIKMPVLEYGDSDFRHHAVGLALLLKVELNEARRALLNLWFISAVERDSFACGYWSIPPMNVLWLSTEIINCTNRIIWACSAYRQLFEMV